MSTANESVEIADNMTLSAIEDVTDIDQKTLRAYLRRNFKREDERKGSRWGDARNNYVLNKKLTTALLMHFGDDDVKAAVNK
jgi:hypothetical protein